MADCIDITWKYQAYKITIQRLKCYYAKFKEANEIIKSRQSQKNRQYKGREKDS